MNRIKLLNHILKLEREWDLMGGPDYSPKRNALMARIRPLRQTYEEMTQAFIRGESCEQQQALNRSCPSRT